ADLRVAAPHGAAEHPDGAVAHGDDAEQRLQEGRFAGAVGAQDGDELAGSDLEVDVAPHFAPAQADGGVLELQRPAIVHVTCAKYMRMSLAIDCKGAEAQSGRRRGALALRDPGASRLVDGGARPGGAFIPGSRRLLLSLSGRERLRAPGPGRARRPW